MMIYAIVAFGVALLALRGAWRRRRKWSRMAKTETFTCAQLRESFAAGPPRRSSKVYEVVGAARPGPGGPMTAMFSGVSCVWHRHALQRRSRDGRADDGTLNVRTNPAGGFISDTPFALEDSTGSILVYPGSAEVDEPERVAHGYISKESRTGGLAERVLSALRESRHDRNTLGWEHEEWAIRPGTRLYVLGAVSMAGDELRIGKPGTGKLLISTRTEAELTGSARRMYRFYLVLAALAVATGVALLLAEPLGWTPPG